MDEGGERTIDVIAHDSHIVSRLHEGKKNLMIALRINPAE